LFAAVACTVTTHRIGRNVFEGALRRAAVSSALAGITLFTGIFYLISALRQLACRTTTSSRLIGVLRTDITLFTVILDVVAALRLSAIPAAMIGEIRVLLSIVALLERLIDGTVAAARRYRFHG
jgi:hypothetical protein